jgi:cyclic nucleotide gated channel
MGLLQIAGAFWYLFAVERNDTCWRKACTDSGKCDINYLYCGNKHMKGYNNWKKISEGVLGSHCAIVDDNSPFNYGIYTQAISSGIVSSRTFFSKFCYCLWWGLQNLRYLAFDLLTFLHYLFYFLMKEINFGLCTSYYAVKISNITCQ